MPSVFTWLARRGSTARREVCAAAATRPVRVYVPRSAAFLDSRMPAPGGEDPVLFRSLLRGWADRDTADQLTEALHRMELERTAQPVFEVTVATPPQGIPRADLARLVRQHMDRTAAAPREHRVLPVLRDAARLRSLLPARRRPAAPAGPADDDTQSFPAVQVRALDDTQVIPAVGDDGTQITVVRVT